MVCTSVALLSGCVYLLGQVALALVTFFALSLLLLLFFFCFSFLPFCLDLGVIVPFQRLLFCAFALTSSSSFLWDFLLPPGSGVLRSSCLLFFLFEVFLSSFEVSFLSRPFFFFGGEVWLGPSVFGPALWSVDSSLGSGKIRSSGPLAVQLCFYSACGSDRTLEFLHCEEVSGGPQVVRSDPGTFCWCCGNLSLPRQSLWPISLWALGGVFFFSVFLSSAGGFHFTAFSRQLAAIGVLFVVFSTGCCLNGLVLCSCSSQLSFSFPANVCCGPGGVIPIGPLRVLIRLLRLFCSFLSTFVFFSSFLCLTFSMTAELHFSVGLGLRAAGFSFVLRSCSRSFCFSYPKVLFHFHGA